MTDSKALNGQVAIVTGGSRGIGRRVCERLAELGAHVVVNFSQNAAAAEQVVAEITNSGGSTEALGFDVSNASAVDKAFADVISRHGRLDILVNNAGIAVDGLTMRMKPEDWQRTIDINLSGCFYCARAAMKPMMKARYGRVINVSSVIGETGNAGQAAYSASKSGIFGLTKSLAQEMGSRGITVNAITPGFIATDMTKAMSEEQKTELLKRIPLGRLGGVDDVADVIIFLTLPGAAYVTGQIVGVNGGLHM